MIKILFEDNHLLVVEKPINIPVQEDNSKDDDLLNLLKADLKKRYNKPGNVYLGLVHRLDRPVGGVMVFAKTSKAASRLSDDIRTHKFLKTYLAIVCSTKLKKEDTLVDYLIKDTKTNTVYTSNEKNKNAKKSILHYKLLSTKENMSLVKINLETGRPHQIRVQFSSRNAALYGDQRYNKNTNGKQQIALWAFKLNLIHPITKKEMIFTSYPKLSYPWSLFEGEL